MDAEKKMTMQEAADKGLLSQDVAEEKREQLKQLFPEIFTDGQIDFEQLRRVIGDWVEPGKERYGLNWPGKADCMKIIQAPSIATLKPDREESVDFDDTENLFIEGDNLEVLKLLQKAYFGKIKVIYIDPPYNTGNEFIYPDDFSETLDTYLDFSGQKDTEGRKFSTNSETSGRFHARWLSMMYPRLYLARNLLTPDGVIFISIDNHELSNLMKICNEIFGEENFLGIIARATGQTTGQDGGGLGSSFDFALGYCRDNGVDLSGLPLTAHDLKRFDAEDGRGRFAIDQMRKTGSSDLRSDRPSMFYPVEAPDGTEVLPIASAGYEGRWRFENATYKRLLDDDYILWKKTKRGDDEVWWPYVKYYAENRTKRPSPLWTDLDGNKKASRDLRALFDGKKLFDYPKPIDFIERLAQIAPNANENDIILDFFAGSCATAHATLSLNKQMGSSRKFIVVQLPEPCDPESEAYKAGFSNVADLGKERIRRSAKSLSEQDTDQLELKDSSSLDFGFRVFKLASSNFRLWNGSAEDAEDIAAQLDMHVDHIDKESGPEDILYELLLKAGFQLTTKVEKQAMAGKDVFSIADGALLICLDKEITPELVDALADADPLQVICLDEGFKGNDQLKTNAVQTFKSRAKEDEEAIVFRTV